MGGGGFGWVGVGLNGWGRGFKHHNKKYTNV